MKPKNTFCWIEIPVVDMDRAIQFYSTVLNDQVQKREEQDFVFGLFPHTEDNVSGNLALMEDRKPSQDGPLIYLDVEGRLKDAVNAAKSAGGKVLKEIQQIGLYGHRAVVLDTEGNAVALYSKEV